MARRPQILVVDDEIYLREIIALDLESAGYAVLQAANGAEGLAVVKSASVDLVVSDVRMPSCNGIKFLEQLRAWSPGHPAFVFITAYADISSEEALHLGAESFLRKPLDKDELLEVVAQALIPREARWSQSPLDFDGVRAIEDAAMRLPGEARAHVPVVMGQGGMFLAMTEDLPGCFEVLRFDLDCPALANGRLTGHGRVRWTRHEPRAGFPAGIGVEFLSLTEETRQAVSAYLAEAKPQAFIPLGGGR